MVQVAKGVQPFCDSSALSVYKEVQIHGPLQLNRDVDAIVVHPRYRNNEEIEAMLLQFQEQNGCKVIWMPKPEEAIDDDNEDDETATV